MPDSGLLAGFSSGVVSTAVLHPIDLIKVRFQVQDSGLFAHKRYNSIFGAGRAILAEEGVRGFYKGILPGMTGSATSWGLYFFFYERYKRFTAAQLQLEQLRPHHHSACAMAAGCSTVWFTNPIWLIKTRMQLQLQSAASAAEPQPRGERPYRGMVDAFRSILRTEGVRGLYRGVGPALLLTSHGAIQFAVYEEVKRVEMPPALQPLWVLGAGSVSKVIASGVTYPYQVIKSRIQARDSRFKGILDCASDAWRREGAVGFYRGFAANLLRVVPGSAITLTAYELLRPVYATLLGEQ